ncbi:UNVERIFIED_CONTAM: Dirigent protein 25 [Sesamum latifolium]|uniref:Dirigent protein n=1 Tax=Sesamum latifolium TaxID=2727402 RepID=A0AAW2Y4G3_9LAMI
MASHLKTMASLLILALIISSATSARILDEEANAAAPAVVPAAATTTPGGTAPITPANPGGAVATTPANPGAVGGQVPFAKPNGAVLPVNNGIPTNNANGGIVNNNNIPFLTGLSGFTSNIAQNNNGNNIIGGMPGFPVLDSSQFPSGTTLQKLMFGTMTVFDDELTEGHELGSGLVGKAQGFYISSSEDGTSQTMAFTVMFTSGSYADSLSFFGVHRTRFRSRIWP